MKKLFKPSLKVREIHQRRGVIVMRKRMIVSLILTAITVTLSGCNSPKAANKENFAKLLKQDIANNPYKLGESISGHGHCTIELFEVPHKDELSNGVPYMKQYGALEKAGILKSEVIGEKEGGWRGPVTVVKYDFSEKGKQIAKQQSGNSYYLPYCQVAFKEIKSFTEPADAMGAKVSQVNYTFTVEKVDDWVNHPDILNEYPIVKRVLDSVGQPRNAQKTLVLTNEGWSTGGQ